MNFSKCNCWVSCLFLASTGFSRPHKVLPSAHTHSCRLPPPTASHTASSQFPQPLAAPHTPTAPPPSLGSVWTAGGWTRLTLWVHPCILGPSDGVPEPASLPEVAWPPPSGLQVCCSVPLSAATAELRRPSLPSFKNESHPAAIASTSQAPLGLLSGQCSWGS